VAIGTDRLSLKPNNDQKIPAKVIKTVLEKVF